MQNQLEIDEALAWCEQQYAIQRAYDGPDVAVPFVAGGR